MTVLPGYNTPAFAAASYCGSVKADARDLMGANMLLDGNHVGRFESCMNSLLGVLAPVSDSSEFKAAMTVNDMKGQFGGISGAHHANETAVSTTRNADHTHAQHQASQDTQIG